jgi:hypothetical protein
MSFELTTLVNSTTIRSRPWRPLSLHLIQNIVLLQISTAEIPIWCGWQGTPVSPTNKTDLHDITEILLKVALNTINQPILHKRQIKKNIFISIYKFNNLIKIQLPYDHDRDVPYLSILYKILSFYRSPLQKYLFDVDDIEKPEILLKVALNTINQPILHKRQIKKNIFISIYKFNNLIKIRSVHLLFLILFARPSPISPSYTKYCPFTDLHCRNTYLMWMTLRNL